MKRVFAFLFKGFWRSFFSILTLFILISVSSLFFVLKFKQNEIVQTVLEELNYDFKGRISLAGSHISFFQNFPYISIDLEDLRIYETKDTDESIVEVHDLYVGFDLLSILSQEFEIKKVKASDGVLHLIQYEDGELNIVKAFEAQKELDEVSEALHLNLKKIELTNIDIRKEKPDDDLVLETYIFNATSGFKQKGDDLAIHLISDMEFNIIMDGDTSYYKHKHLLIDTDIQFDQEAMMLEIAPTEATLAEASFDLEGSLDLINDSVDFHFFGDKKNFDLFLAFAPDDVQDFMNEYTNQGRIKFDAKVQGSIAKDHMPALNVNFSCEDAAIEDKASHRNLSAINFHGVFTNGPSRTPESMEFRLDSLSFKAGEGYVKGRFVMKNFDEPDVDFKLSSDFDLGYLAEFFKVEDEDEIDGQVKMDISFHDIIDLDAPEKTLEKFEESYYMSLDVSEFRMKSAYYELPLTDFNFHGELEGNQWNMSKCSGKIGKSDFDVSGSLSNLPAIVHHTNTDVDVILKLKSDLIDLYELTGSDSLITDEQIKDFSMDLKFVTSAKKMTESPTLPQGEFFIENMYAQLTHYPHTLHDFHADVLIEENELSLIDFKGEIDKSDFLFSGSLSNYNLWFEGKPKGHTNVRFDYFSDHLNLEDVFTYKGEHFVPEEYRHEEFDHLKFHGEVDLFLEDSIKSIDLDLSHLEAGMKIHPMRFEELSGRIHYEDDHIQIQNFGGELGKSDFKIDLNYYLGDNQEVRLRDNHFALRSHALDLDELLLYEAGSTDTAHHEEAFNIYKLPFVDMAFKVDINDFKYHRYHIKEYHANLHITTDHYLHLDKMYFKAAGGEFNMTGYFNGSDPEMIYFNPDITITNIDLDKLLFKFENFGQDHVISENIHGNFSGRITGKIHVHPDFTPKLDDSDISMDVEITDGALENLLLLEDMSDYFKDKNLKSVKFDTLSNHFDFLHGKVIIPNMEINSTLGHLVIEGEQTLEGDMDYYLKIPWNLINQVAYSKLFKKKKEVESDQEDAIQYAKDKQKYVSIRIWTVGEEYRVKLSKKKKRE